MSNEACAMNHPGSLTAHSFFYAIDCLKNVGDER